MHKLKQSVPLASLILVAVAMPLLAVTPEETDLKRTIFNLLGMAARLGGYGALGFGLIHALWAKATGEDMNFKLLREAGFGGVGLLLFAKVANMIVKEAGVASASLF